MKFYVVLIVTYADGTNDKVAIYNQPSADAAIKAFHSYMSQYVNVDNVATVYAVAINNVGGRYKEDTWVRTVADEVAEPTA